MRMLILSVLLALLIPALASAQPAIVFDTAERDFGTIAAGPPVEHVFEFVNAGDEDLVIRKLDTP
jgi:hypothetical protein